MNKLIEWRSALWSRRLRGVVATAAPGGASVLSRERVRELEQPTYLRRRLAIAGLPTAAPAACAARPQAAPVPVWPAVAGSRA
jgi:hypothetical protein